jgi:hypothetical protein
MPEKEHSATFENSKLFPDNQLQMEHSRLLMFPDNVDGIIFKAGAIIHTDSSQTGPAVKVIGEILKMFGNTYNFKKLTNSFCGCDLILEFTIHKMRLPYPRQLVGGRPQYQHQLHHNSCKDCLLVIFHKVLRM